MKAPNEKLIETLFTYYALRHLEGEGASVYTPSSREEYLAGYDAKLMVANGFDELYLQFKTPYLCENEGYSFTTTQHQHLRLQDYPHDTAYYVTHIFRGVDQIQQAKRDATGPLDFLRWYVAIEIGRLDAKVQRFRYSGSPEQYMAYNVLYKLTTDRKWEHPKTPLDERGWMPGDELLRRFQKGEAGAHIILADMADEGEMIAPRKWLDWERAIVMSPERAEQMVRGGEKTDWGTMLRKNIELVPDQPAAEDYQPVTR